MPVSWLSDMLLMLWVPAVAILALSVVAGRWVVLGKMGCRRWAALIPLFSDWEVVKGASGSRTLGVVAVAVGAAYLLPVDWALGGLGWVDAALSVAWLVTQLVVADRLARAFGAGPGYAAALVLLPFIGYPLLTMDGRVYLGPVDVPQR